MQLLPKWVLPPTLPSVYDMESVTVTEAIAKLYGAMQTMIQEYNDFADQINNEINTFTGSGTAEREAFRKEIENRLFCKFNDLDARMGEIRVDLMRYAEKTLSNAGALPLVTSADNGKMMGVSGGAWKPIVLQYDPETESLNFGG